MLVGHIAVAVLAKRATPAFSLGTSVLAALLPDLLWPVFMLAGLERVNIVPGRGAAQARPLGLRSRHARRRRRPLGRSGRALSAREDS
jgi:hypothetical protein